MSTFWVAVLNISTGLDPLLLDYFADAVDATDAIVVLSSDWRKWARLVQKIRLELVSRHTTLHCKTPVFDDIEDTEFAKYGMSCNDAGCGRTYEILTWLDMNAPDTTQWVAIDDMELSLPAKHFVHTNNYHGLTPEKAQEVIRKLTNGSGTEGA